MAKSYFEKLRDPRWQRKRLEIMKRDDFACVDCGDNSATLNVHHKFYRRGFEPWNYADEALVTLCEPCHEVIGQQLDRFFEVLSKLEIHAVEYLTGICVAAVAANEGGSSKLETYEECRGFADGMRSDLPLASDSATPLVEYLAKIGGEVHQSDKMIPQHAGASILVFATEPRTPVANRKKTA